MAFIAMENDVLQKWFDYLESKGFAPKNTRRVIIDIQWDNAVMVYYETFADKAMFDFDLTGILNGAEIKQIEKSENEKG
jgi:hypothetical protein